MVESLKRVLNEFDIDIRDIDPEEVEVGPNIVRFKVWLTPGERQQKIEQRSEDIAREMALENEPIIHRLPNTRFIAVDVPRQDRQIVRLNEYIDNLPDPTEITAGDLPFIAGVDPSDGTYVTDMRNGPHMLVGGTTGSGKIGFLSSLLACILETQTLDELDLAIIDPKLTNFMFFQNLPNLVTDDIITDADEAYDLFDRLVNEEIPRRKEILGESGSVDIVDHNSRADDLLSPMVVIVDEYADLLDAAEDDADQLETNVRRIAQIARSVGIHLVIATQRPSANIINTDLRSNLAMRAAFRVPSDSDSRVILDESGAEELGGDGDMLFKEGNVITRLQGTLVEPDDLRDLVDRQT
jgi:DNA segregation ATPase FtsK/SpoIIIE-like protein